MVKKWDNKYSNLPIKFFLLYNREAHLEWQGKNWDERRARAEIHNKLCENLTKTEWVQHTLVDDVKDKVNNAYGGGSNSAWVVDKEGKLAYWVMWYRYTDLDKFLTELAKKEGWQAAAAK